MGEFHESAAVIEELFSRVGMFIVLEPFKAIREHEEQENNRKLPIVNAGMTTVSLGSLTSILFSTDRSEGARC